MACTSCDSYQPTPEARAAAGRVCVRANLNKLCGLTRLSHRYNHGLC